MNDDCTETKKQILAYLRRHPEAGDTIDGILEWWLLEERIIERRDQVERAVSQLIAEGQLIRDATTDVVSTSMNGIDSRKEKTT